MSNCQYLKIKIKHKVKLLKTNNNKKINKNKNKKNRRVGGREQVCRLERKKGKRIQNLL